MKTQIDKASDEVVKAAIFIATRAAKEYLDRNHLAVNVAALAEFIAFWVTAKWDEAVNDAKEALACGMNDAATATFGATMALAGIEAAKEASIPTPAISGNMVEVL